MDVFSTELEIRLSFIKFRNFRGVVEPSKPPPPSLGHWFRTQNLRQTRNRLLQEIISSTYFDCVWISKKEVVASWNVLPTYSLGISWKVHAKHGRNSNRLCSEYEFTCILPMLQKHAWSDFYGFCIGIERNVRNICVTIPVCSAYLSPKLMYEFLLSVVCLTVVKSIVQNSVAC
jgi:hypothetical protein